MLKNQLKRPNKTLPQPQQCSSAPPGSDCVAQFVALLVWKDTLPEASEQGSGSQSHQGHRGQSAGELSGSAGRAARLAGLSPTLDRDRGPSSDSAPELLSCQRQVLIRNVCK